MFSYACKIKEAANGRRRSAYSQTQRTLSIVTERCFARDVQVDEQKRAAQNGQDQAQRKTDQETTLKISLSLGDGQERSFLLQYCHHVSQRFVAHLTRSCEGMVKDINQKQNQRDRYRERSGKHILRLHVLHSKQPGVRNREYPANKQD